MTIATLPTQRPAPQPCPRWCNVDHTADANNPLLADVRLHQAPFHTLPLADLDYRDGGELVAFVSQFGIVGGEQHGALVEIALSEASGCMNLERLTPAEARQLATLLNELADAADPA